MEATQTLDARGLKCPMPIIKAKKAIDTLPAGGVLKVVATDPGSVLDFQGWVKSNAKYALVAQEEGTDEGGKRTYIHFIRRNA